MPKRKKFYKKKKHFRRRRQKKSSRILMNRIRKVSAVPDKMLLKMKYVGDVDLSASGMNSYVYSLNSLFDPDVTATGHQPLSFDQWENFYSRYKVYASSISLMVCNNHATESLIVATFPGVSSILTPTDVKGVLEQSYCRSIRCGPITGNNQRNLKHYCTTKSIRGERILDDDYTALFNANPTKRAYWLIVASNMSSGATSVSAKIYVKVTYYCELFRRKQLAQS